MNTVNFKIKTFGKKITVISEENINKPREGLGYPRISVILSMSYNTQGTWGLTAYFVSKYFTFLLLYFLHSYF